MTFEYNAMQNTLHSGGDFVANRKIISPVVPDTHTATEFLKGQASRIFDEIVQKDNVVIVNKHSKPQNVIISYNRYKKLKNEGVDI
mgnify:FL=1